MNSKANLITIRSANEDGFYFTFDLPGHKVFVRKFYDTFDDVSFAVDAMRAGLTNGNSIRKCIAPEGDVYFIFFDNAGTPVGQSVTFDLVSQMEIAIGHLAKSFPMAAVSTPSRQTTPHLTGSVGQQ